MTTELVGRVYLFLDRFKELRQFACRLVQSTRVVHQLHGQNWAKLGKQVFDKLLKYRREESTGLNGLTTAFIICGEFSKEAMT